MVLVDPTEQTEGLSHSSVLKQGAAFPGSSNSHPHCTRSDEPSGWSFSLSSSTGALGELSIALGSCGSAFTEGIRVPLPIYSQPLHPGSYPNEVLGS